MPDPICRDYNATTPVASEMLQAMLPRLRTGFGNPSSTHPLGRRAAQAEATARHQVAELIGAKQHEPVFAGCATKANNLAVLGVAHALGTGQGHLVVSSGQHPAVMAPALNPRDQGLVPTVLPGAGQGHGLPPGSADLAVIDGFGAAAALAMAALAQASAHLWRQGPICTSFVPPERPAAAD